jgi:hypothetical protein
MNDKKLLLIREILLRDWDPVNIAENQNLADELIIMFQTLWACSNPIARLNY